MLPATRLTPRLARPLLFRAINTPSTPSKTHESDSNVSSSTARTTGENRIPANDPQPRRDVPPTQGSAIAPEAHPTANNLPSSSGGNQDALLKQVSDQEIQRTMQAPNRAGVWSRSQQPRERAMTGPRFEQTMMEYQPRPLSAMELIHKQPVAWTDKRMVSCDGGGGPLGHPRIFINVDKAQVCQCTYCGLPFASKQHEKYLRSLPSTPYPLDPIADPAVVEGPGKVTDEPYHQR